MDWSECSSPQRSIPLVTSGGDSCDRGQVEWPQSPSDDQPRLWHVPQQKQRYDIEQTNDEAGGAINASSPQFYAAQVSPAEYEKQKKTYTVSAVNALTQSPEYQRRFTMCQLCWCSWYQGETGRGCQECGGYALSRPCPICNGRCSSTWHRDVEMSHSQHFAHWDGSCSLPEEEKVKYMHLALMTDASEDDIVDDMDDLSTS